MIILHHQRLGVSMSPRALVKLALDDRSSSYGLYGGMIGVGAGTGGTSAGPVSPRGTGGSLTWDDGKRFALLSDGASGKMIGRQELVLLMLVVTLKRQVHIRHRIGSLVDFHRWQQWELWGVKIYLLYLVQLDNLILISYLPLHQQSYLLLMWHIVI
jgi:hypothetical protein